MTFHKTCFRLMFAIIVTGIMPASCKKKTSEEVAAVTPAVDFGQGTGQCRISAITERDLTDSTKNGLAMLEYDEQGQIKSIVNVGCRYLTEKISSTVFRRDGDMIIAMHSRFNDTVMLHERRPVAVAGSLVYGNYYYFSATLSYDGQGRVMTWARDTNYDSESQFFTWQGADLQSDSTSDGYSFGKTMYEYYSDKSGQYANPLTLADWLRYGTAFYEFGHLPKYATLVSAAYPGGHTDTFSYAFDKAGKVAADTIRGDYHYYNTFSYDCK